jgi:hypothetical protein
MEGWQIKGPVVVACPERGCPAMWSVSPTVPIATSAMPSSPPSTG